MLPPPAAVLGGAGWQGRCLLPAPLRRQPRLHRRRQPALLQVLQLSVSRHSLPLLLVPQPPLPGWSCLLAAPSCLPQGLPALLLRRQALRCPLLVHRWCCRSLRPPAARRCCQCLLPPVGCCWRRRQAWPLQWRCWLQRLPSLLLAAAAGPRQAALLHPWASPPLLRPRRCRCRGMRRLQKPLQDPAAALPAAAATPAVRRLAALPTAPAPAMAAAPCRHPALPPASPPLPPPAPQQAALPQRRQPQAVASLAQAPPALGCQAAVRAPPRTPTGPPVPPQRCDRTPTLH